MTRNYTNNFNELQVALTNNENAIDAIWIILTTFIIFTMQSGFALLESGMVSRKNEANVMVKNLLDVVLGGLSYWCIGFGIAYGRNSNKMAGGKDFFTDVDLMENDKIYSRYFQHLALATTSTTIISGAIAERINLRAYMILAIIHTGICFPFPAHWMWHHDGWLKALGAYDFAGSCIVHVSGGTAALVSCIAIGPRRNRFGSNKEPYIMASPTNVVLGTFFLWFGWIGFNCGSTNGLSSGSWRVAVRCAIITINGACGGGIAAVILSFIMKIKRGYLLDIGQFSSGILGGLVGITAIASSCQPWEGFIIGFISGLAAIGFIALMIKFQVDDPVGAIGIHWCAGSWGMIAVGLFSQTNPYSTELTQNGLFYGGNGKLLAVNILSIVVVSTWSGICTLITVLLMKYTIKFRLTETNEVRGSDDIEHDIKDPLVIFKASHAFGKRIRPPKTSENHVIEMHEKTNVSFNQHVGESVKGGIFLGDTSKKDNNF